MFRSKKKKKLHFHQTLFPFCNFFIIFTSSFVFSPSFFLFFYLPLCLQTLFLSSPSRTLFSFFFLFPSFFFVFFILPFFIPFSFFSLLVHRSSFFFRLLVLPSSFFFCLLVLPSSIFFCLLVEGRRSWKKLKNNWETSTVFIYFCSRFSFVSTVFMLFRRDFGSIF